MTELDSAIQLAFEHAKQEQYANKVYVTFFRTLFYVPAFLRDDQDEPFTPYFVEQDEQYFIPVFDSEEKLQAWLTEQALDISHVEIEGSDIIRGVSNQNVYLALNPATDFYKEFSPEEITRLKFMTARIDNMKKMGGA